MARLIPESSNMTPSLVNLARQVGRNLQTGDILIAGNSYYEIIETGLKLKAPLADKLFGRKEVEGLKIRKLTPYGPEEKTKTIILSDWRPSGFETIIRSEERTDKPSLKER